MTSLRTNRLLESIARSLGAPTSTTSGNQSSIQNRSNSIIAGGNAQVLVGANTDRKGLFIQNISDGDLWINDVGTASTSQPSIWLPPGACFEYASGLVPLTAISIYGATTGQAFTAREW